MARILQPTNQQTLLDAGGHLTLPWVMFFQSVCDLVNAMLVAGTTSFANDAAAAAGGVALGQLYFDGTGVRARLV